VEVLKTTGPSCQSAAASHSYLLGRKLDAEFGGESSEGSGGWEGRGAWLDSGGPMGFDCDVWLCMGSWVSGDGNADRIGDAKIWVGCWGGN
jgi:hypothetical protein